MDNFLFVAINMIIGKYPFRPVSEDLLKVLSPPIPENTKVLYDQPELAQHILKSLLFTNQKHFELTSPLSIEVFLIYL